MITIQARLSLVAKVLEEDYKNASDFCAECTRFSRLNGFIGGVAGFLWAIIGRFAYDAVKKLITEELAAYEAKELTSASREDDPEEAGFFGVTNKCALIGGLVVGGACASLGAFLDRVTPFNLFFTRLSFFVGKVTGQLIGYFLGIVIGLANIVKNMCTKTASVNPQMLQEGWSKLGNQNDTDFAASIKTIIARYGNSIFRNTSPSSRELLKILKSEAPREVKFSALEAYMDKNGDTSKRLPSNIADTLSNFLDDISEPPRAPAPSPSCS